MTLIDLAALGLVCVIAVVLVVLLIRAGGEYPSRDGGTRARRFDHDASSDARQVLHPTSKASARRADRRGEAPNGDRSGEPMYRVHWEPEQDSPHWNPFDAEQSRTHRARSARVRSRSPRPINFYQLLGVDASATDEQIQYAYKRRVSQLHPDQYYSEPERRESAEEELKKVNAAMEILRDPLLRARYDAGGEMRR